MAEHTILEKMESLHSTIDVVARSLKDHVLPSLKEGTNEAVELDWCIRRLHGINTWIKK